MTFASNFQRQQLDTEGWSKARAVLGVSTQAREGTRCCLQGVGAALTFPRTIYMDTALSTSLGRDPLCLCECTTNSVSAPQTPKVILEGSPPAVKSLQEFSKEGGTWFCWTSQPEPLESKVQEEGCHDQCQLTALSCREPELSGVSLTAEELPSPQAADFNAEGMISTALPVHTGRTMYQPRWKFLSLKSHLGPQS